MHHGRNQRVPPVTSKRLALPASRRGWRRWLTYRREWFPHDLIAGVSVAAVALPTAIAYAQIIGLDPVAGLYAAIPACWPMPCSAHPAT